MKLLDLKINGVLHVELQLFTGRPKKFELKILTSCEDINQEHVINFNSSKVYKLKDIINNTVKVIKHEDRSHLISVLNLVISSTTTTKD